jgi:hypothetical protein
MRRSKSAVFWLLLVFTTLVLGVMVSEISLSLFAALYDNSRDLSAVQYPKPDDRIHVSKQDRAYIAIVLGESTSTSFQTLPGFDWPSQLESLSHGTAVELQVSNLSQAGTTTGNLVDHAIGLLKTMQPNIVITMMGVNDGTINDHLRDSASTSKRNWFERLKTYRLVKSAFSTQLFRETNVYYYKPRSVDFQKKMPIGLNQIDITKDELKVIKGWMQKYLTLPASEQYQFFEGELLKLPQERQPIVLASLFVDEFPVEKLSTDQLWLPWKLGSKLLFDYDMRFPHVLESYALISTKVNRRPYMRRALAAYSDRKLPVSNLALSRISAGLDEESRQGLREWNRVLRPYSLTLTEFRLISSTPHNYLRLARSLKRQGVCHVALSYPNQDASLLKQYFAGQDWLLPEAIVSQRESFQKVLKAYSLEEVFTDTFAGDFGHTTQLGHKIIAENAFKAIRQLPKKCFKW